MLDKEYIVREIWSDWWNGKGDDGLIFPEASYKHHILTEWVNDNYGDDNYDWSKIGQLNYNFKDYYDELIMILSIKLDTLTARILKLSSYGHSRIVSSPCYSRRDTTDCRADPAVAPVAHEISPDHRF